MKAGFAGPVFGAQAAFRAAMEAMARPGTVHALDALPEVPDGLEPAAAALVLALVDDTTPFWTDAGGEARAWIAFHTGAPSVPAGRAAFLLATGAPPPLATLELGSDEAPQEGATLIMQVAGLSDDGGWALRGPGIREVARLRVGGVAPGFVAERAALAALAPRGVDLFLACGARLAALPRSTRMTEDR